MQRFSKFPEAPARNAEAPRRAGVSGLWNQRRMARSMDFGNGWAQRSVEGGHPEQALV